MECQCSEMPNRFLFPLWIRGAVCRIRWQPDEFLVPNAPGMTKRKPYQFLAHLKVVDFNHERSVGLGQCSLCNQLWQIDWSTNHFEPKYAVKIPSIADWLKSGRQTRNLDDF